MYIYIYVHVYICMYIFLSGFRGYHPTSPLSFKGLLTYVSWQSSGLPPFGVHPFLGFGARHIPYQGEGSIYPGKDQGFYSGFSSKTPRLGFSPVESSELATSFSRRYGLSAQRTLLRLRVCHPIYPGKVHAFLAQFRV